MKAPSAWGSGCTPPGGCFCLSPSPLTCTPRCVVYATMAELATVLCKVWLISLFIWKTEYLRLVTHNEMMVNCHHQQSDKDMLRIDMVKKWA